MPKKGWYSAIVILVIFTVSVVSGADNKSDVNETKADTPLISIAPIEVNIPPIEVLPVKVQNPVKAEIQKPEAITVNAQTEGDKSLTVYVKKDWLTFIIAFATAFAAIATVAAAIAAWRVACSAKKAVKTTKDLAEAQLFTKLIEEYSSPGMGDDLHMVFNWYNNGFNWNQFDQSKTSEIFKKAKTDIATKKELNKARRHVTHYLLKIRDLKEAKYIKEKFVEKACSAIDTKAIYALFPLECAKIVSINKDTSAEEKFNELKKKFNELLKLSGNLLDLDEKFDLEKGYEELA
ncbi:MAG: hypothetical protein ABIG61_14030 [Planctomycetota bacterium]